MFGSSLADIFRTPDYDCKVVGPDQMPEFAVTRLRSGPREMEKAPEYPPNEAILICVSLTPAADETSQSQQEKFPLTDVFKYVEVADGRVWLRPEGVVCFAGDLSEAEQKVAWPTHYAPAADLFSRNAPGTTWKSKPTWYIVAYNDRTVHPNLQRFLAKRMDAATHAVDSSHVAMLSHPGQVIDIIRAAASAVQE